MKKLDLAFSILQVPLDYGMLLLAGIFAYWVRYQDFVTQVRPVFFDVNFDSYFKLLVVASVVGVVVFALMGLYRIKTVVQPIEEFKNVFFAVSTTLLIIIISIFLQRELFSSRFIILLAWGVAVIFTLLGRYFLFKLKTQFLKLGVGSYHVVLVGDSSVSDEIKEFYERNKSHARRVIASIKDLSSLEEQLSKIHSKQYIDEVIFLDVEGSRNAKSEVINFASDNHITLRFMAGLQEAQTLNVDFGNIAGYPILTVNRTSLEGWGRVLKRLSDVILGIIALVIALPFMLLIAVIIILDSRGPVFVSLNRVGQKGKAFKLYKFRSMVKDAAKMKKDVLKYNERDDGPLFKMKDDPRITKFGKFLRRSSLDELPQLLNVLKGDMSLVGPRPHEPEEVDKYQREYKKLLTIKPGITGAAQVSGRSKLPFDEEAKIDIYYIENWSLAGDVKIILKTPKAVLNYKEVY